MRRSAPKPASLGTDLDAIDFGGDAVDRALRLGTDAVGRALIFSETGSHAEAEDGLLSVLPDHAIEGPFEVIGPDGDHYGLLRAVGFGSLAPLDWTARRALSDVAALIAGDLATRQRLGQSDHVTGLPNRRRFAAGFERAVALAGAEPQLLLITLADARHYNEILRALGHECAEGFVRAGADRVKAVIGRSKAVSHISVLSFAFLTTSRDAERLAREIVADFARPVISGTLPITTRIGVGIAPVASGAKPAEALRSALAAAQDSRRCERGYAFYDHRSDEAHMRAFRLLTDLGEALRDDGQLALAYQPRIDLESGRTVGAEALVRWSHPGFGAISPTEFIPLAETTALIGPLTDFVMTSACRQTAAWRREGLDLKVSVNVSPTSLHDDGFLDRLDRILAGSGVEPEAIELELTEGMLASAEAGVQTTIEGLRARGLAIAIDDFGSGFSNLEYLTRLHADVIKIDRSLVRDVDVDDRRAKLCRALIDLTQSLDFHVVAEGIETVGVYDKLAGWGCDEGQGFHMSRPLTAPAFAAFAASR